MNKSRVDAEIRTAVALVGTKPAMGADFCPKRRMLTLSALEGSIVVIGGSVAEDIPRLMAVVGNLPVFSTLPRNFSADARPDWLDVPA